MTYVFYSRKLTFDLQIKMRGENFHFLFLICFCHFGPINGGVSCPEAYEYKPGYMSAVRHIGQLSNTTLNECADKCTSKPDCNMVLYHTSGGYCFLYTGSKPNAEQFSDYIICTKIDICPENYSYNSGQRGWGAWTYLHFDYATLKECSEQCNNNIECSSFDHGPSNEDCTENCSEDCFLYEESHPLRNLQSTHYKLCVKIGDYDIVK